MKLVETPSGKNDAVMFYPYDGSRSFVIGKMNSKWREWENTIHEYSKAGIIKERKLSAISNKAVISELFDFWINKGS